MFQVLARITDVPAALEMLQPRIRGVGRGGDGRGRSPDGDR